MKKYARMGYDCVLPNYCRQAPLPKHWLNHHLTDCIESKLLSSLAKVSKQASSKCFSQCSDLVVEGTSVMLHFPFKKFFASIALDLKGYYMHSAHTIRSNSVA